MNTEKNEPKTSAVPRLRELRIEHELTQLKLQDMLELSQHVISDWELGRCEPSIINLMCLADVLNTTIDYLVGRTDER